MSIARRQGSHCRNILQPIIGQEVWVRSISSFVERIGGARRPSSVIRTEFSCGSRRRRCALVSPSRARRDQVNHHSSRTMARMTASMQPSGELGGSSRARLLGRRGGGKGEHEVGGSEPGIGKYRAARASSIAQGSRRPFSDGRKAFEIGHTIGSGYRKAALEISRGLFSGPNRSFRDGHHSRTSRGPGTITCLRQPERPLLRLLMTGELRCTRAACLILPPL